MLLISCASLYDTSTATLWCVLQLASSLSMRPSFESLWMTITFFNPTVLEISTPRCCSLWGHFYLFFAFLWDTLLQFRTTVLVWIHEKCCFGRSSFPCSGKLEPPSLEPRWVQTLVGTELPCGKAANKNLWRDTTGHVALVGAVTALCQNMALLLQFVEYDSVQVPITSHVCLSTMAEERQSCVMISRKRMPNE